MNKAPEAKEKFASINDAYETLGDEGKRRVYDQTGMSGDE
jgi:molecular chaperone DnaJ